MIVYYVKRVHTNQFISRIDHPYVTYFIYFSCWHLWYLENFLCTIFEQYDLLKYRKKVKIAMNWTPNCNIYECLWPIFWHYLALKIQKICCLSTKLTNTSDDLRFLVNIIILQYVQIQARELYYFYVSRHFFVLVHRNMQRMLAEYFSFTFTSCKYK